jgi:hypothetical protein
MIVVAAMLSPAATGKVLVVGGIAFAAAAALAMARRA